MSVIRTVFLTVIGCFLLLAICVLAVAYGGLVDVAATEQDNPAVHWFLETTRESWVHARAEEIEPPKLGAAMRANGLRHYQEMCVTCHGAPGVAPDEIGSGLNPSPPELWKEERDAAEDFWVVKHGIRMTGMPAFGPTHDDEALWGIVAFLQDLQKMDAGAYAAALREAGLEEGSGGHGHGGHEHGGERASADDGEAGAHDAAKHSHGEGPAR